MTHDRLRHCPLCAADLGSAKARPLAGYERDYLVSCRKCGFVFSDAVPSDEDYARVYGNYDYEAEDAARTELNIAKERQIVKSLMAYRSTGQVIDVAAGAGRFLERFAERGFTCDATEFSDDMCAYLEQKDFKTFRGGLFPEGAEDEAYDIVVFTEIIEHINNPRDVLQRISRLLRPGGCLYVTTPNFASFERRVLKDEWGMICWPEHITYWTPKHLDRALRDAGLVKRRLETENISPYRIIQALQKGRLRKLVGETSPQAFSDKAQQQVAASPALGMAKRLVNLGLRVTGLGSSIVALYEKPNTAA